MDANEEVSFVGKCLTRAQDFRLESEVVWSALIAMKANPELSIEQAMTIGLNEWDLPISEHSVDTNPLFDDDGTEDTGIGPEYY